MAGLAKAKALRDSVTGCTFGEEARERELASEASATYFCAAAALG